MAEREASNGVKREEEEEEEEQAKLDIWKYVLGFTEMAVVKCAIELGIADALDSNGGSMSLSDLSSAVNCSPASLRRIMRFLIHRRIFREGPAGCYSQSPLSRLLRRNSSNSWAAFVLLESSPVMLEAWHGLSARASANGTSSAFVAAHGDDVWGYAAANPEHSKLIEDAMACDSRVAVPAIIRGCPEVFEGVGSLVDVGGGDGTTMGLLVKSCPSIRAINFDLPHVVAAAAVHDGVVNVAGDMFRQVPNGDAVFLKWVLHDWGDDECIDILKRCKEAIPQDKGKVIIIEAVIEEHEETKQDDKLTNIGLMLDMVMMAHTNNGKERTLKEWGHVLHAAGFHCFTLKHIQAVQSVIVAYP